MPACPHCSEYYFGNPNLCPKCNYSFSQKRVIASQEMETERDKERRLREEQARRLELEVIKNQERENQKAKEEKTIQKLNPQYEYATEYIYDTSSGAPNKTLLDSTISSYAQKGWRLHSIVVNESGHNSSSAGIGGISSGTNATICLNILVFERCVKLTGE